MGYYIVVSLAALYIYLMSYPKADPEKAFAICIAWPVFLVLALYAFFKENSNDNGDEGKV